MKGEAVPAVGLEAQASKHPAGEDSRRGLALFVGAALLSIIVDQASKAWIRAALPVGDELPLLPGWVHLSHVTNKGAAWGLLSGRRWLLIAVTLGVMIVVSSVARDFARRGTLAAIGLGLILGGAVGNLIDRALFGFVLDFIDLDTPLAWLRTFPVWNGADAALTVGVVLLLLDFLRRKEN